MSNPDPFAGGDGLPRLDGISTPWNVVRQAHAEGSPEATQARVALVLRYHDAVRRYVAAMLPDRHDAEEVAQDTVVRLLEGRFAAAAPDRGRFRDLLKVSVRNLVIAHLERRRRDAGLPLDGHDPAAEAPDPPDVWEAECRAVLLRQAWTELETLEFNRPGNPLHTVLRLRADHFGENSASLAERISAACGRAVTVANARQLLRRARLAFAEALVRQVAAGLALPTADAVAQELADLGLIEHVRDVLPEDRFRAALHPQRGRK